MVKWLLILLLTACQQSTTSSSSPAKPPSSSPPPYVSNSTSATSTSTTTTSTNNVYDRITITRIYPSSNCSSASCSYDQQVVQAPSSGSITVGPLNCLSDSNLYFTNLKPGMKLLGDTNYFNLNCLSDVLNISCEFSRKIINMRTINKDISLTFVDSNNNRQSFYIDCL